MDGGTSSGPIVAASVENPGSPEAVFVPFSKADVKQLRKIKKKDDLMNKIVESLSDGSCNSLLSKILLSEGAEKSPAKLLKEARELRRMTECKKNKDKFREMLRKKRAERNKAAKADEKEEKPAEKENLDQKQAITEALAKAKERKNGKSLKEGKSAKERVSAALAKLSKKQISERKFDREAELLRSVLGRKDESSERGGQTFKFDDPLAFIKGVKAFEGVRDLEYNGTEDGVMIWADRDSGDRFEVGGDPENHELIDAAVQAILNR